MKMQKTHPFYKLKVGTSLFKLVIALVAGLSVAIVGYTLFGSRAATVKPADLNNDGTVSIFDLSILLSNYGRTGDQAADLNADNTVNIFDMSILLSQWGQSGSVAALCNGYSNWSDPATWGGNVPAANSVVSIPAGKKVKLDVDAPHLNGVNIPAGTELCFPDRATTFSAKEIIVMGKLTAGSAANPLKSQVTIRLEGGTAGVDNFVATGQAATAIAAYNSANNGRCIPRSGQCINLSTNMGTNIMTALNGGSIELYGENRGRTWTKLVATSSTTSRTVQLIDAVEWKPGDVVAIASGSLNPLEAEKLTIESVAADGKSVTFTTNPAYRHAGIKTCLTSGAESRCVEERSEIGLLSRNLKIAGPANTQTTHFGGHTIILPGGKMNIRDVELYDMGQEFVLGRYPLHFHILGDAGRDSSITNVSLHDNVNRQVTIHGSNNVRMSGVVAHKSIGHSIMLEDGTETRNVFTNNLVMTSLRNPDPAKRLRFSDHTPAEFWITHPNNDMSGNSAAGGQGTGIWYDFTYDDNFSVYYVQGETLGVFDNNIAHSHLATDPDMGHANGSGIMFDIYYGDSTTRHAVTGNSAWKNENFGLWIDGLVDFVDTKAANNGVAYNGQDTAARGGVSVAWSDNTLAETEHLSGLIRFYHGQGDVDDVWLGNFGTIGSNNWIGAIVETAASSWDATNRVRNLKFFGSGYRTDFVFCTNGGGLGDCYGGSTASHGDHYFEDLDGSVKGDGVPAIITNAKPFLKHPQQQILSPNIQDRYYGTANRTLWTPKDRNFMRVRFPDESQTVQVRRDSDGQVADISGTSVFEMGKRYKVVTPQDSFDTHSSYPGWVELYMDRATAPTAVAMGGYNEDQRDPQPKASSLAKLGQDGAWWYENGKVYIRMTVTGNPIPFGKGGEYGNLSGNGYWSIR
jgi:hypothetical protein